LRCQWNLGEKNDDRASAIKLCPDRLQLDFSFTGASDAVEQNWLRIFTRIERSRDLLQCPRLLLVQNEVRRRNELFVGVRVAHHCLLAQLREAAFDQRAQCLVIEGCLAQEVRRTYWSFQLRDRV